MCPPFGRELSVGEDFSTDLAEGLVTFGDFALRFPLRTGGIVEVEKRRVGCVMFGGRRRYGSRYAEKFWADLGLLRYM
jgi:hypothetical protein